jgi:hypothetical protein
VELAAIGLQARGFEPIIIDGLDPAGYLWGLYEMCQRQADCVEAMRLERHPVSWLRCIALVSPEALGHRSWAAIPAQLERERAGAAA